MTIQKKIEKYAGQFKTIKRTSTGEEIVVLKNDADKELKNSVMGAHGDRLPDDWIYQTYQGILDSLAGYDIDGVDKLEDIRHEVVDGLVDVYTSGLTNWLNISPHNVYYLTEAQEEYGTETDGFNLLMLAQYKAIDEIFGAVYNLITK